MSAAGKATTQGIERQIWLLGSILEREYRTTLQFWHN
jgi:hypothetical protein